MRKVAIQGIFKQQLDLMFMKHYALNRCLYIKVAKLRTGVGNAETSHMQCQYSKSTAGILPCLQIFKVQI